MVPLHFYQFAWFETLALPSYVETWNNVRTYGRLPPYEMDFLFLLTVDFLIFLFYLDEDLVADKRVVFGDKTEGASQRTLPLNSCF